MKQIKSLVALVPVLALLTLGACDTLGGSDKADPQTTSANHTETFTAQAGYTTAEACIAAAPGTDVDSDWRININSAKQVANPEKPADPVKPAGNGKGKPPVKPPTKPAAEQPPCPDGQERINACCTKQ